MRYLAFACDYDGTLAHHGLVAEEHIAPLQRLKASGRSLILVTGRQLDDLAAAFPRLELFDRVVAENGAVLLEPATRKERVLTEPPDHRLVAALRARAVSPLSVGRGIVATWQPHETVVLEAIRDLGLELRVVFNKGAVMVLPAGVSKASGLAAALTELGLSPHNTVGIGDAENDHAFLAMCECAVAVDNALPSLKAEVDVVTRGDHGFGVAELIEMILTDDLANAEPRLVRHHIRLGQHGDGAPVQLRPYGTSVLVAGGSGGGKSTLATTLIERLAEKKYQFCVIDPEADYESLAEAVTLGSAQRAAGVDEVIAVLADPAKNVVVNLAGVRTGDRPGFFASLAARLSEMRSRTGRPHWFIIDEAHHVLPATRDPRSERAAGDLHRTVFITVDPETVNPEAMRSVNVVIGVGPAGPDACRTWSRIRGVAPPPLPPVPEGQSLIWDSTRPPAIFRPEPSQTERRRHRRKYAEGDLGRDRSFYFRGREGKLKLRAQNLSIFAQLAEGVDDDTWLHHLRRGEYSRWFREEVKDETLADEAAAAEADQSLPPDESRRRVIRVLEERYTLPATQARAQDPGSGRGSG